MTLSKSSTAGAANAASITFGYDMTVVLAAGGIGAFYDACIEFLLRVHGGIDPTSDDRNTGIKTDGTITQTFVEGAAGTWTLTTTAGAPGGAASPTALTALQAERLVALVRRHAGIDPMVVSETSRSDGAFTDTIVVTGGVTTFTPS